MVSKHGRLVRACIAALALSLMAVPLAAAPSECSDWAVGEQTGDLYKLTGTSTRTVTTEVTLEAGGCGGKVGTTTTTQETFNVGYYKDTKTGAQVAVNCSTGQVL